MRNLKSKKTKKQILIRLSIINTEHGIHRGLGLVQAGDKAVNLVSLLTVVSQVVDVDVRHSHLVLRQSSGLILLNEKTARTHLACANNSNATIPTEQI